MQTVSETDIPAFMRGTRLQHDRVRDQWFVQAPEKAFLADPIAAAILQRVNGESTLGNIIDALSEAYAAPRDIIAGDVVRMVQDLAERQVLTWK
ncbi:MAG: pyrroloquinoline quinone biosynthesis peptide chaperone PqqD [Acetobacter sp.]|jgi:pyrroloquinoline quinone biosynthesis protein D|nr:pyrroloquinoline quinone biosynthesis peptide chaperone PqqD [Acetobacter sp.]MCH4060340.1 pyrroloquinoline quinone biosynthesis peptide chaperone PqqD [Acetobacter sp.]MCH4087280.1 pyrroloquinoline quinone biosynthesis peptide chaperone PqqD [Acetobacter sp.]MCI1293101.1 pyrroloquinoline quinone biosynthesis peptide chaperone PqqD [Acetobacter sp.]MCI1319687.1 pyrroloquinoline quinone biosynthesis peptide chaperone PqqD [Acetobacter sp.]